MAFGIYKIENTTNGKTFVDIAKDVDYVWSKIQQKLCSNCYHNSRLQKDWIDYGEDTFEFEVLEVYRGSPEKRDEYLRIAKRTYIKEFQSDARGYNINLDDDIKTKEKWPGNSKQIYSQLDMYIGMRDQTLQTSEERSETLEGINDDDIILDYIGSQAYVQKQIKHKDSFLSEKDFLLQKLMYLGNYIVFPDQKEYGIMSNNQMRNVGRGKPDKNGHRSSFCRTWTFTDIIKKVRFGDGSDDYNVMFTQPVYELTNNDTFGERLINNTEPDIDIEDTFDFGNVKHVLILLRLYDELKNRLLEDENEDSGVWILFETIDDLIDVAKFNEVDLYLLELVKKDKLSYKEIVKLVNDKFGVNYSYRQIEHRVREGIPWKLVNTYRRNEKRLLKYFYKYVKNSNKSLYSV